METLILENVAYQPDKEALIKRLHLDGDLEEEFDDILSEAARVARPKVMVRMLAVEVQGTRTVKMDAETFESRILAVNLEKLKRAFAYVVTCGRELYELSQSKADPLERYWVDTIAEQALGSAMSFIRRRTQEKFHTGKLRAMNPGSLADWPIGQQKPLFRAVGDVMGQIGVQLTDSCLMLPVKSGSGLLFETEQNYENCSMCPRVDCPNRRAEFDKEKFNREYAV